MLEKCNLAQATTVADLPETTNYLYSAIEHSCKSAQMNNTIRKTKFARKQIRVGVVGKQNKKGGTNYKEDYAMLDTIQ